MGRTRVDPVAGVAAVIALIMAVLYVWVMRNVADAPVAWFRAALIGATIAAAYGANQRSPHRSIALFLGGLVLIAVGMLALLSIGLPILVAGALCLSAALADQRRQPLRAEFGSTLPVERNTPLSPSRATSATGWSGSHVDPRDPVKGPSRTSA